ncbi:MAG: hypothetical protein PUC30_12245 [Lachnospiraceae bacterium]|nr:hypothetical protein [Lachnospiraceae bacterium]
MLYLISDSDGSIQAFKELFLGIYNFMREVELHVFDIDFTLYDLFLWGAVGAVAVWFLHKFLE